MNTSDQPTSIPVFRRVLKWSAIVAAAVAVIGGVVGFIFAGWPGLVSALIGAALTLVFAGITVLSVILAARLDTTFFMATILGAWILKFIVFLGVMFAIKDQPFIHDWTLWGSLVAAVVGTLAVDVVCVLTGRMTSVSDTTLDPEKSSTAGGAQQQADSSASGEDSADREHRSGLEP